MRYKYKHLTQTQLGKLFGVSSHVIGEWLVKAGLRDGKTKKPTAAAHLNSYCDTAPSGANGYHWVWDSSKTVSTLTRAGHRLADDLPDELVYPPAFEGPFAVSDRAVLNATGEAVLRATTREQAEAVTKLLNAAHRHGTLAKLLHAEPRAVDAAA